MSSGDPNPDLLLEKLRSETECCICTEVYSDPRFLPCHHTFCLKCLITDAALKNDPSQKLSCSICRQEYTTPAAGLAALPKNFSMMRFIEMLHAQGVNSAGRPEDLCDSCLEPTDPELHVSVSCAEMFCADCQQKLCEKCTVHHRKNKMTKLHTVVSIGSQPRQTLLPKFQPEICDIHKKVRLLFCEDCDVVICPLCFVEKHNLHKILDAQKHLTNFSTKIKDEANVLSKYLVEIKETRKKVLEVARHFITQVKSVTKQITERGKEMKELIDKHVSMITADMISLETVQFKEFKSQVGELNKHASEIQSTLHYYSNVTPVSAKELSVMLGKVNKAVSKLKEKHAVQITENISVPDIIFDIEDLDFYFSGQRNIVGKIEGVIKANSADEIIETASLSSIPNNNEMIQANSMDESTGGASLSSIPNNNEMIQANSMEESTETTSLSSILNNNALEMIQGNSMDESPGTTSLSSISNNNEMIQANSMEESTEATSLSSIPNNNEVIQANIVDENIEAASLASIPNNDGTLRSDLMLASLICEIRTPASMQYRLLISGVTVLYDALYVVHHNSSCINCYHANCLAFDRELFVAEMSNPEDIASSDVDGFLYVVENDESQDKYYLLKLNSSGDLENKWCVGKNSFALSISRYGNVIIAFNDKNVLKKYSCDGRLLSELTVSHSPVCNGFKHAVEIDEDRLLVCYREEARKYGMCLVDMNLGRIIERYSDDEDTAGPLRSAVSLASPMYLAVGEDRNIFVVDKFCRLVLMFSSDMKDVKVILSISNHVHYPDKLCLDSANGRLFLIDNNLYDDQDDSYSDSRLPVFDIRRTVNLFLQQENATE